MSTAIKRRRGTTVQHSTFIGQVGEFTYDTDKKKIIAHDGVTAGGFPTDFTVNAARYGMKTTATATANATALAAAIADVVAAGGGAVYIPMGNYAITQVTVPALVELRGDGRNTVLTSAQNGFVIECGGTAGALYYSIAVKNIGIVCTTDSTSGIRLQGTAGAVVEHVYIEGTVSATNAGVGVAIDGGNTSSFFNKIDSVIVNHMETGFKIYTSGTSNATTTTFINCSAFGDVGSFAANGSKGFTCATDNGQGSTWIGGNFEECNFGIDIGDQTGRIMFFGARFEGNTTDIRFGSLSIGCQFVACANLTQAKITDNSGTGFGRHHFIGCVTEAGAHLMNEMFPMRINGTDAGTTVPLRIRQYPSATVNPVEISDSNSANVYFSVDPNGAINKINALTTLITNGNDSPEGTITAPVGSLWMRRNGGDDTLWYQKISGSGNTGWAALLNA